jgi:Zn-dependent M28 family amino/carboxypeptidase
MTTQGIAALLELALLLKSSKLQKNVRFVFFVNEEPPFFQTDTMGSRVYARKLRSQHVSVSAMISLETIGCYSDLPDSQKYPPVLSLLYPSRGNFIGFVGNTASRNLVRRVTRTFRESTQFPSQGIAAPDDWPGVGWSDQWSFWQEHYPAIMVTDTAPYRYRPYHTPYDTADKVDFEKMARVVEGVRKVIVALASSP